MTVTGGGMTVEDLNRACYWLRNAGLGCASISIHGLPMTTLDDFERDSRIRTERTRWRRNPVRAFGEQQSSTGDDYDSLRIFVADRREVYVYSEHFDADPGSVA